jgi:hypothetical protein
MLNQMILLQIYQPVAAPILAVSIWLALFGLLGSLCSAMREGFTYIKRLHQIPCSHCAFYTGDYRLKCPVHPCRALTEDAIDCLDYEPTTCRPPCCQPSKKSVL